jgi:ABC-type nitrate/sulfonate/bicarbonate transport system substrate-binding protein
VLDATNIAELQDYSEVSSTGHKDIDRLQQLMREKKWLKADEQITEFVKQWLFVAQWCRERHETEEQLARMNIGQELLRHLHGMEAR